MKKDEMPGSCGTDGEMRNLYKILVGNLKGKDSPQDLGVYWRTILEWMLEK
jgi:hypothetical protein